MPRVLSDRGIAWLEDIPPQFRDDPDIKASIDVQAREFDRFQLRMDAITNGYFPPLDTGGVYLAIWEALMNISVNPGGYTTVDRLARDVAFIQSLGAGATGTAFEGRGRSIVGPGFTYREHMLATDLPTNFIVNPSFETNTTGWLTSNGSSITAGATLTQDATAFQYGTKSGKVVTTAASARQGIGRDPITTPPDASKFVAGKKYTFSVWLKGNAGGEQLILDLGWDGGSDKGSTNITLTSNWARYTVDWIPSADRTSVLIDIVTQSAQALTWFVDGVMVVDASKLAIAGNPLYFDGSITNFEWTGTAHASTSRLINVPDNTIRIDLSLAATSQQAQDTYNLMRAVLPAHIALSVNYGVGFVVGVSHVGVDAL